jgi:hypothetical protein
METYEVCQGAEFTSHGCSNHEESEGKGMWHVCGRNEIYTRFCWRILEGKGHFEDLVEDGVLKCNSKYSN